MTFKKYQKFAMSFSLAAAMSVIGLSGSAFACAKHKGHHGHQDTKQANTAHKTQQEVDISGAWARQMMPTAKVGAGYFEITNNSDKDIKLVSIKSTVSKDVQMHSMIKEGNVMKMRHLKDGLSIKAHKSMSFKPGSYHIMFMNPKAPFKKGETIKTEFTFDNGKTVEVPFSVRMNGEKTAHKH